MQGSLLSFLLCCRKTLTIDDDDKYKSVEWDGQLNFVKARDKDVLKTIGK